MRSRRAALCHLAAAHREVVPLVVGLIDELGLDRPVIGGYDIGSRIRPDRGARHT
jgi:hypothetical protein